MEDSPVEVGSMLYTLVEPHEGHEVAYNRWYERDHFYAGCMIGPWLFAGRRWVATRRLKDLRFPAESTVAVPVDAGSYLAVYWVLDGHHEDHFEWASEQVHHLYAEGRGFPERTHVHTVLFDRDDVLYRDEDPVPVELALDHPYPGLVSVFLDRADGTEPDELAAWLRDDALPELLSGGPVASVASWSPFPREGDVTDEAPMDLGSATGGERRTLQLFFCETDPSERWDRFEAYGKRVEESGRARVALAAPFIATVPGTDRYVDELR